MDTSQGYLNADERADTTVDGKESFTIDRAALQLVGYTETTGPDGVVLVPAPGWSEAAGVGFTVNYAFRSTEPATMPSDTGGFSRFNAAQILQVDQALQAWADVANIQFVRVGAGVSGEAAYSNNATVLFANYATGQDGFTAFAYFPGNTSPSSRSGDVWVNSTHYWNSHPSIGNFGGEVLVHEIGHAIGLTHPGDYDVDPDTKVTYAQHAEYYEDSRQYTVMSYFSEGNTGAYFAGRYAAAPMLDDIAAAQLEYGVNPNTRTGDTVYGFNSTADRDWFVASWTKKPIFAVWDAGGQDTFDFSGYFNNQIIDLRAGFFSDVGGYVGNVAIAQGTSIENAIGGTGSDVINGNDAANGLFGGGGSDTLSGGDGQDYLRGGDGSDSISGGAAFDDLNGNRGRDTLYGGDGDDWVVGGKDPDLLYGETGNDIVLGNIGNDTVYGGVGDDVVRGGKDDDQVDGGAGNDFVSGDQGYDTLIGGPGADLFHTFIGAGVDRVLDFSIEDGDRVLLLPGQTWTVQQWGADTVVTVGNGDRLTLVDVQVDALPEGWIFGY